MAYRPQVLEVVNGGTGLASTTTNQILYSSGTSVIAGLATANSAVLATNGSGVPSITATPTVTSITFGAGTALSVYAEGTYTPTIFGSGTAGTPTYTAQAGFYTKIGDMAICNATVSCSSIAGSPTGTIQCGGLPFTTKNTSNNQPDGSLDYTGSISFPASRTYAVMQIQINSTQVSGLACGSAQGHSGITISSSNFSMNHAICYHV